jgi:hypothetical protein
VGWIGFKTGFESRKISKFRGLDVPNCCHQDVDNSNAVVVVDDDNDDGVADECPGKFGTR